jgi:hypothetical protein
MGSWQENTDDDRDPEAPQRWWVSHSERMSRRGWALIADMLCAPSWDRCHEVCCCFCSMFDELMLFGRSNFVFLLNFFLVKNVHYMYIVVYLMILVFNTKVTAKTVSLQKMNILLCFLVSVIR